jgi:hypothetical protein
MPFYPSPGSLLEAVEHAIECGADALHEAASHLRAAGARLGGANAGCCSSAYGGTVWHSEAIDLARAITDGNLIVGDHRVAHRLCRS